MSKKVLVAYGTCYGAAESASEDYRNLLRGKGLNTRVVNAKKEKIKDISGYDLVVAGSGMQMAKWTGDAENFLRSSRKI